MNVNEEEKQPGVLQFSAGLLGRYPMRSAVILLAFLVAGLMEGIGVGSLLPLLSMLQGGMQDDNFVTQAVQSLFNILGLEPGIGIILGFVIVLIALKSAFSFFALSNVGYATASMANELRQSFIRALMGARWSYFGGASIGRSTNTLLTETDRAALSYMNLCKMLADTMLVIVYVGVALLISWEITLAAFVAGIVAMAALYKLVAVVKKAGHDQTVLLARLSSLVTDALASLKPIKAMGRERYFGDLLNRDVKKLWKAKRREVMGFELLNVGREPIIVLFVAAGLYGVYSYADLSFTALLVMAFMFLRVVQKLTTIQMSYQKVVAQESAYWAACKAIAEAQGQQEMLPGGSPPHLEKAVTLENVSFSYRSEEGLEETVLKDVSCSFPVKQFHAVIGPSGAGKTTLLNILLGFSTPDKGRVLIDDLPLGEADIRAWRDMIGYVPQDSFLLHDTLLSNITLGEDFSEDDVKAALEQAGILSYVEDLPEGLYTVAGERGLRFSGGQRQRIALARALVRKPALLLLDEPTSALDRNTEITLMETLKDLAKTMTILAISHSERVKTYADQVYVLDQGQLVSPEKNVRYG